MYITGFHEIMPMENPNSTKSTISIRERAPYRICGTPARGIINTRILYIYIYIFFVIEHIQIR